MCAFGLHLWRVELQWPISYKKQKLSKNIVSYVLWCESKKKYRLLEGRIPGDSLQTRCFQMKFSVATGDSSSFFFSYIHVCDDGGDFFNFYAPVNGYFHFHMIAQLIVAFLTIVIQCAFYFYVSQMHTVAFLKESHLLLVVSYLCLFVMVVSEISFRNFTSAKKYDLSVFRRKRDSFSSPLKLIFQEIKWL